MIKIYHNARCGKSRAALKALVDGDKKIEVIEYLTANLNYDELEKLIKNSNYSTIDFVRTKEKIFIEKYKNKNLSDKELIEAIIKHPELLQRPIIVSGNKVSIARDEDAVCEISTW